MCFNVVKNLNYCNTDGKQEYKSDCKGKQSLGKFIARQILRLSAKRKELELLITPHKSLKNIKKQRP
jgi:hypothetical protein